MSRSKRGKAIDSAAPSKRMKTDALLAMPRLCLGLNSLTGKSPSTFLAQAIDIGYRHFDGAESYGFLEDIGTTFSDIFKKVPRQEIWITFKSDFSKKSKVEGFIRTLKCEYIDFLLIHHDYDCSGASNPELVAFLDSLVQDGLIRYFGFSNCEDFDVLKRVKVSYPDTFLGIQVQARPPGTRIKGRNLEDFKTFVRLCNDSDIAVQIFATISAIINGMFFEDPPSVEGGAFGRLSEFFDAYANEYVKKDSHNAIIMGVASGRHLQAYFDNFNRLPGGDFPSDLTELITGELPLM